MKIISHRGYWKTSVEKNTLTAFERSFYLKYGIETDIRDCNNHLVIAHDLPCGEELHFNALLNYAEQALGDSDNRIIAINIKSDGLATLVAKELATRPNLDCFVFDMSIPDMQSYLNAGVAVFTRMSEVETNPVWLDKSAGVWLDCFSADLWYTLEDINKLTQTKRVCIVSEELHNRDYNMQWELLYPLRFNPNLILCTDLPEKARSFFKEN